jgi:hypothetical protein
MNLASGHCLPKWDCPRCRKIWRSGRSFANDRELACAPGHQGFVATIAMVVGDPPAFATVGRARSAPFEEFTENSETVPASSLVS